jgi:putative ABC transport system permease protein
MFKNYLKIAIRIIRRHKGFSFINIAGLAIGMACCILILLWVQDELSYDRFHENGNDIYRVIQDINFADHSTTWAITQGPLGPSLKKDFPEIINAARITSRGFRLTYDDKSFDERVGMADGSIFEMFTFPLVKGNLVTALSDPHSIVLTEEMAEKYFGNKDPVGKAIKADNQYDFLVTGVLKKIPRNSHLQFDFLIPFIFGRELNYTVDRWGNSQFSTYVQLQKGIPSQEVIQKISGHLSEKPTIEKDARLNLQPLYRVHLYSNYEFDSAHGNITYVTIFSIVAFLILLIACINFMNLATARSGNRAREVGMRKVAGAYKTDIIRQFFGESILLAFIALFFALIIVQLLLPVFNNLAAKELSMNIAGNIWALLGLLGIALLTGIISGTYPALFLSTFQPVRVLKGSLKSGTKSSVFRKILVVAQFSLTILLIICTTIVYNQLNFMRNRKLGYNKEHMIYMDMRGDMREKFEAVKNELMQNANILGVTASSNVPTYGYYFSNSKWRWDGQNPDEETLMRAVFIDYDYFKTFGMEIAEGRSYSKEFSTDATEAIMINEAAVKAMGMQSPIGKSLSIDNFQPKIIGVVKNYHFRSLDQEIDPLILAYNPNICRILFAKLKSDKISQAIGYIESIWKKFAPGYPFNYRFLDEALDGLYRSEQRIGTILKYFSTLAIFISCLGLFGLASFMAEQRTKEIGIRKVLGATVSNIVLLLSKEFSKWVLWANIIAWPVAYYAMNRWLQSYAYHINITLWSFLLAAGLALIIALLTVCYQATRAALTNPVDSLRYE